MGAELKGMRVFLSGAMTGVRNYNCGMFCDIHAALVMRGVDTNDVFNPALHWLVGGMLNEDHEACMRKCIHELTRKGEDGSPYYDMLIQLNGWRESAGARTEATVAHACGIEVVEVDDALSMTEGRI